MYDFEDFVYATFFLSFFLSKCIEEIVDKEAKGIYFLFKGIKSK